MVRRILDNRRDIGRCRGEWAVTVQASDYNPD